MEHAAAGVDVAVGAGCVVVGTGVEVAVRTGVAVRISVTVAAGVGVRVDVGGNGVTVGASGVAVALGVESRVVEVGAGVTVRTGVGVRRFPPLAACAVDARLGAMMSRAATTTEIDVLMRMSVTASKRRTAQFRRDCACDRALRRPHALMNAQ